MVQTKIKSLGIAGLVLGISSIITSIIPLLGVPLGILAIIFSVMQKKRYPIGMATAGLVTGIIGIVLSVLVFILTFAYLGGFV